MRLPDKVSNALYAIACASNIGNIGGLVYKCSKEIAVRERLRDVDRGGDVGGLTRAELEVELDRLLMSPYWLRVSFSSL